MYLCVYGDAQGRLLTIAKAALHYDVKTRVVSVLDVTTIAAIEDEERRGALRKIGSRMKYVGLKKNCYEKVRNSIKENSKILKF